MNNLIITTFLSLAAASAAYAQELVLLADVDPTSENATPITLQDTNTGCRYLGAVTKREVSLSRKICTSKGNSDIERNINFEFELGLEPLQAGHHFDLDIDKALLTNELTGYLKTDPNASTNQTDLFKRLRNE